MVSTMPSFTETNKENRRSNGSTLQIIPDRIDHKENKLFGSLKFQSKAPKIKEEDPIPLGPITPLNTWLKV